MLLTYDGIQKTLMIMALECPVAFPWGIPWQFIWDVSREHPWAQPSIVYKFPWDVPWQDAYNPVAVGRLIGIYGTVRGNSHETSCVVFHGILHLDLLRRMGKM